MKKPSSSTFADFCARSCFGLLAVAGFIGCVAKPPESPWDLKRHLIDSSQIKYLNRKALHQDALQISDRNQLIYLQSVLRGYQIPSRFLENGLLIAGEVQAPGAALVIGVSIDSWFAQAYLLNLARQLAALELALTSNAERILVVAASTEAAILEYLKISLGSNKNPGSLILVKSRARPAGNLDLRLKIAEVKPGLAAKVQNLLGEKQLTRRARGMVTQPHWSQAPFKGLPQLEMDWQYGQKTTAQFQEEQVADAVEVTLGILRVVRQQD